MIGSDDGWKYLAAEIEHIQPFRERYGFLATDEVLGFAARVLIDGVNQFGTDDDFIGHFGDERFAIITYLEDPGALIAGLSATSKRACGPSTALPNASRATWWSKRPAARRAARR
ncbi:MAG: hypothetical protein M5R40_17945 [Anaerolineae bacterium]|nr:hypothetical protein [Anaerolineae bacterium]